MHPAILGLMTAILIQGLAPRTAGPLTDKIVIVVDASCSMEADDNFEAALAGVRMLLEQPTDAMQVAVMPFGVESARYPTKGFVKLPDAEAVKELTAFCASKPVSGAATNVTKALRRALTEPKDVSIVLVSDGEFVQGDDGILVKLAGMRPVMTLTTQESQAMVRLGRESGGGAWLIKENP